MIDRLQEYLHQYKWTFEEVNENTLLTGFVDTDEFTYPITISVKNDIITMLITFQSDGEKLSSTNELLLLMLRLNFAWPIVKLGLDEDFEIILALDLYNSNVDYNTFAFGLDILTETAQTLVYELGDVIRKT